MEPIKQEIINNIFENGDKLITGPILQTVLIDMIDDVNVKDQEILSKTGSWDEAVTQIPNLATKAELTEAKDNLQANITNLSESVARDLENVDSAGYATEQWVQDQGYLTEHQDISNLATKGELNAAKDNLQGNITSLSESVARDLASVPEGVATEQWVQNQGYLKEHQDISGLATKTELNEAKDNLQGNITSLSESVARDLANVDVDLTGYATEAWVQGQDYASKSYVDNAVSSSSVDLTGYATETWVESQGYLKEHQDISNLATKAELNSVSESIQTDISNLATKAELNEAKDIIQDDMITLSGSMAKTIDDYTAGIITEIQNKDYASKTYVNEAVAGINLSDYATKSELTSVSESVQTDITNLSESVANSAVWKKGEGQDSVVQVIAENNGVYTPLATGKGAIATGLATTASEQWSHAEGGSTVASGWYSHAEGKETNASGESSHAEGASTKALEYCSHAEGLFTTASGVASHAEGVGTTASIDYSHAEGEGTLASGYGSHAEGYGTIAANDYEHAQGTFNHSSENQIFSVGAGDGDPSNPETATRRNAISVIAPWDSKTGMPLPYFFVKGVGSYNGTNPEPGINDLATVISDLPSGGGGSSETLWKKGEGQGSIVQKIASGTDFPTATGTGSVAIGWSTGASGDYSHAEGNGTIASGSYSHAEGSNTKAEGSNSHAEGWSTKASGEDSHAEGYNAKALGLASHAEGWLSEASGQSSHAEGFVTKASGSYSHAEGSRTVALGDCSHAEGDATNASGICSHAEGYATNASGNSSHAEGFGTNASGTDSHAEGCQVTSSGQYSHAEGWKTIASNQYEHAQGRCNHNSENQIFSIGTGNSDTDRRNVVSVLEVSNNNSYTGSVFIQNIGGYDGTNPTPGTNDLATVINNLSSGGSSETLWKKGTGEDSLVQKLTGANEANTPTATETGAIAIGSYTTASGMYSHAEGVRTNASGVSSHAEGSFTNASGNFSHAEGDSTLTSNDYEHAQGRYNYTSSNQIFSIGTGTSTADRRNAVSVLEVNNSGRYTSSFFVQNIGGYDGTNPTPGTNDLATVVSKVSSIWKKGEGKDSIVQLMSDPDQHYTGSAAGWGAVAIGANSGASGNWSHAEGNAAIAGGNYSHAEGIETRTSGPGSHAEGYRTVASNNYEHAQGMFNHSSANQIFSVGAGERIEDLANQVVTENSRNAISVLAVPNSDTQVVTASFFVQNIGGYDGTNPIPGTNDLATVINNLPSSGGSSETLWKKGTGTDSIVQKLSGDNEADMSTATGTGSIATGKKTTASGDSSHAEGISTTASGLGSHAEGALTNASSNYSHAEGFMVGASGNYSHAEGYRTSARGEASHAEGYFAVASNDYEHAQGRYNHNSENQIFSIGTGNSSEDRRNAVSVLEVSNNNSYTSSFFVQNVGGYDGTNPIPGTNDLATVISNLPSGGTSSETWTFTLEDGSTVTKNIVMR